MKRIFSAAVGIAIALSVFSAAGQSGAEWTAYKQQNGIAPGWTYNEWVAAGCPRNTQSASPGGGMNPGQQMLNQAASQVGQQIGKSIGDWLFGNNSGPSQADIQAAQAAQQAEQARQAELTRQAAEEARLGRIANSTKLRTMWNANDEAMSEQLSGVFDTPGRSSTPRSGTGGSLGGNPDDALLDKTSVVDLRGGGTGTQFFGEGNSSGMELDSNDTSLVDLRGTSSGGPRGLQPIVISRDSSVVSVGGVGIQMGTVDPNFLAAQQSRAQQTPSYAQMRWNTPPMASDQANSMDRLNVLRIQVGTWGKNYLLDKAMEKALSSWSALSSTLRNSKGEADSLSELFYGQASKNFSLFANSAMESVEINATPGSDGRAYADSLFQQFEERGRNQQHDYKEEAFKTAKNGFDTSSEEEKRIEEAGDKYSDAPKLVPLNATLSDFAEPFPMREMPRGDSRSSFGYVGLRVYGSDYGGF